MCGGQERGEAIVTLCTMSRIRGRRDAVLSRETGHVVLLGRLDAVLRARERHESRVENKRIRCLVPLSTASPRSKVPLHYRSTLHCTTSLHYTTSVVLNRSTLYTTGVVLKIRLLPNIAFLHQGYLQHHDGSLVLMRHRLAFKCGLCTKSQLRRYSEHLKRWRYSGNPL